MTNWNQNHEAVFQDMLRARNAAYQPQQPMHPSVQAAPNGGAKGKKKRKAALPKTTNTEWYIILAVVGLIALRIIWVNFTTDPPPQAERQRSAKVTAR